MVDTRDSGTRASLLLMRAPGSDDVVVRGGILADPAALLESIEDAIDLGIGAVLSVFLGDPADHDDLHSCVRDVCSDADVQHNKVRLSTVNRLRQARFEFEHDPSENQGDAHFHVLFPDDPTIVDVERFISCFDEPIPNPAKENAK